MTTSILGLSGRVRNRVVLSVVIGIAITICYIAQGTCLSLLITNLLPGAERSSVASSPAVLLVGFFCVILVRGALLWIAEIIAQGTAQATKEELRRRLLSHLLTLGPSVTLRRQSGDLQTTIVSGVEAVESYYSRYIPAVVLSVVGCALVLVIVGLVDWPSALVLCVFVIAFPTFDQLWMRWQMPKVSGVFAAMGAFGADLLDSLQGILTLKAFNASQSWRQRLAVGAARLRRESMQTVAVTMLRTGITGLITLSGVGLVVSIDAWRAASGDIQPFALFMTLFLAREAFRPLDRLEKEFHTAFAANGALASINDLLAMQPPVTEPMSPALTPTAFSIQFEDVSFGYSEDDKPALCDISFSVAENEFIALVGPSGAGKSTIATLIPRFLDPSSGRIRIGGTDIRELSLEALRSLISVVSQDTILFHGTIADNLRIAKPDATESELQAAVAAAHLDAFISGLPKGLSTEIGERGSELSGGQRQRLAIARAILKNAPILILDEATSSVDPASERAIQAAIENLGGRRTLLVIAHRLSTVVGADRVLVLDQGRLVEQGSPQQLVSAGGLYARLVQVEGKAA